MTRHERQTTAALTALIVLQITMLTALYAGIRPHPPTATPLFGIAPFLGASLSVAAGAIIIRSLHDASGRVLSLLAVVMALVSFGPQKYFDAQFALIWPAVLLGQFAALVIVHRVVVAMRDRAGETEAQSACADPV